MLLDDYMVSKWWRNSIAYKLLIQTLNETVGWPFEQHLRCRLRLKYEQFGLHVARCIKTSTRQDHIIVKRRGFIGFVLNNVTWTQFAFRKHMFWKHNVIGCCVRKVRTHLQMINDTYVWHCNAYDYWQKGCKRSCTKTSLYWIVQRHHKIVHMTKCCFSVWSRMQNKKLLIVWKSNIVNISYV